MTTSSIWPTFSGLGLGFIPNPNPNLTFLISGFRMSDLHQNDGMIETRLSGDSKHSGAARHFGKPTFLGGKRRSVQIWRWLSASRRERVGHEAETNRDFFSFLSFPFLFFPFLFFLLRLRTWKYCVTSHFVHEKFMHVDFQQKFWNCSLGLYLPVLRSLWC